MGTPIFKVEDLSYSYLPDKWVLRDVTATIHSGESVVLLGANGSGKTTFLKILAGLLFANKGKVEAFGHEMTAEYMRDKTVSAAFRREVGILLQNSDVQLFCSTVRGEISFGMELMGLPKDECERRTDDLLDMLSIRKLEKEAPHYLSGGEKKKVALASVLAIDPPVLIFDEPTNGLDPRSSRWLFSLLEELKHRGKTLIYSTHHLDHWPELGDKAFLFGEDHRLWDVGTVDAILGDEGRLHEANLI